MSTGWEEGVPRLRLVPDERGGASHSAGEVAVVPACRGSAEFFLEWGGSRGAWGPGRAGQGELGPAPQRQLSDQAHVVSHPPQGP